MPSVSLGRSEYAYCNRECACSSDYLFPALGELLSDLPTGSVVADVGCGNGSLLAKLGKPAWEMHGLEVSESGINQGIANYPQIQFHLADMTQNVDLPLLAGKCDVVMSTEVIEHVLLPRMFAKNCFALLKPGGTLIVSTPYHGYLKNLVLAASGTLDAHFTALWDHGHIKFWSRRTLIRLLQESGFRVTEFRGTGRMPFLWKSMILVATKV